MVAAGSRQRLGRTYLVGAAACFLVFAVLTVHAYLARPWVRADTALLTELEHARLEGDEPPAGPADDWPQWLGPKRDGVSPARDLLTKWPDAGPPVLWRAKSGEGYAAVAVAGGRAYTLLQDGDNEAVVCWRADTGRELWRFRYPAHFANSFGSGPRATPTVDGDRVYTVGATGMLHCLEAATGKKLWEHDLLRDFDAENLPWGVAFSPLVEGDLLFANPGGRGGKSLAAFDKRTGKLVWKALDDTAGYSSPIAVTAAGVRQVVFFTGDGVVGVTPADGKLLWRYPWETDFGVNAATPLFLRARTGDQVHDYVFITSGYHKGCALLELTRGRDGAFAVKPVYEHARFCSRFTTPVRVGDHLFGIDDRDLVCMEVRSGRVTWRQRGVGECGLMAAAGHLLVLGETGTLALVEAKGDGYHEAASYQALDGKCWTPPTLADGRLYLRNEQEVVCLDGRKKGGK
jgi:outer membrane protein assembly factor BamB